MAVKGRYMIYATAIAAIITMSPRLANANDELTGEEKAVHCAPTEPFLVHALRRAYGVSAEIP